MIYLALSVGRIPIFRQTKKRRAGEGGREGGERWEGRKSGDILTQPKSKPWAADSFKGYISWRNATMDSKHSPIFSLLNVGDLGLECFCLAEHLVVAAALVRPLRHGRVRELDESPPSLPPSLGVFAYDDRGGGIAKL